MRVLITGSSGQIGTNLALRLRRDGHEVFGVAFGRCRIDQFCGSAIDVSDGLSTDLGHLCQESGVGAQVQTETIPLREIGKPVRRIDLRFALHGGEDYELLFTAPPKKKIPSRVAGVAIHQIGVVTRGREVGIRDKEGIKQEFVARGWEHFRK